MLPIKKRIELQHLVRTKYKLNLKDPKKMSDWINIQNFHWLMKYILIVA